MIACMKRVSILLVAGLLALAGCGGDDDSEAPRPAAPEGDAVMKKGQPAKGKEKQATAEGRGARITVGDSQFGQMLFDSKKQALYVFQNDPKGQTVCYGECAEAWPPVLTEGRPRAGAGVRESLLGTVKRRDGKLQVTYGGKPIYSYSHEGPGEVRCHNVNLNGGFWWVVGPDGKRRP